ncbi:MAG: hypothetical protein OEX12_07045 [Gammaproteobacteria bacterium]|nr:hypothetical protein [Gammaproteobacteria bacterium]
MSELCKGRKGSNAAHCYHPANQIMTSIPPQQKMICCFCGKEKIEILQAIQYFGDHGRYLPEP